MAAFLSNICVEVSLSLSLRREGSVRVSKIMALCLICIANRSNFAKCLPIRETICFIYLHLTLISLCHPQPSSASRRRAHAGLSFPRLKKYESIKSEIQAIAFFNFARAIDGAVGKK